MRRLFNIGLALGFVFVSVLSTFAQVATIGGRVICSDDNSNIEYAQVTVVGTPIYALSNSDGKFKLEKVPLGETTLSISSYGLETQEITLNIDKDIKDLTIALKLSTLRMDNVVVTTTSNTESTSSTSHKVDRDAINLVQPLSVADIMSLLPGGKSRGDVSLVNSRGEIALRSVGEDYSLVAFGTAIEVDGVRMSNNASMGEPAGIATRALPLSNVESVEIITGIPSVVYGDISSGVVKINTRKSKSPLAVEMLSRPNTKQVSASKGFSLGNNGGVLNISGEHVKSISDIASPYTSYQRNALTLNYMKYYSWDDGRNLLFDMGASANVGGFNDKDDPDKKSNNYIKVRDNNYRANFKLKYSPQLSWLSSLEFSSSINFSDNLREENTSNSSASSLASMHAIEEGYFIAERYADNPNANIILREPGYWYELYFNDSKPLYLASKLIATWNKKVAEAINSNLIVGLDYSLSKNLGTGQYFDDMRLAPSWRAYRPKDDSAMNNFSIFAQEDFDWNISSDSKLAVMAGLRYDITHIARSMYGVVGNVSPRFNVAYSTLRNGKGIKNLRLYAGWGRGVKLPSYSMLNPRTTYSDRKAFSPGSDANNTAFEAYYTLPKAPVYNPNLRWQYTDQCEIGLSGSLWGNKLSIALFHTKTNNTYTEQNSYAPFAFKLTTSEHLKECPIQFSDRLYAIDQTSGIVTISDKNGVIEPWVAPYTERNIFNSSSFYANSAPVVRQGVEWTVDFKKVNPLSTTFRLDGSYSDYQGMSDIMLQGTSTMRMSNGEPYQYIGHYVGAIGVSNGTHSKQLELNLTAATHIPQIGMVFSVRLESTLMTYSQNRSSEAFTVEGTGRYENTGGNIYDHNSYTAAYPRYYSTWDDPNTLIPFKEKYLWAKENDKVLYNDLSRLVETSNTDYAFLPLTVTPYYSINVSVTKELGQWGSLSFYATNFLNNTSNVTSSWGFGTGTLYGSAYIPTFYYGMTLRLKF